MLAELELAMELAMDSLLVLFRGKQVTSYFGSRLRLNRNSMGGQTKTKMHIHVYIQNPYHSIRSDITRSSITTLRYTG